MCPLACTRHGALQATRAEQAASDPADRLWWRSKEALDTAWALEAGIHAAPGAQYILFLQDDIMLAAGFLQQLQGSVMQSNNSKSVDIITLFTSTGPASSGQSKLVELPSPWAAQFGLVAVAIRVPVAVDLIEYLRAKFADAPVDWLLNDFITDRNITTWVFQPNLVEHVGLMSSLPGKQQPIKSSTFTDRRCWVTAS